MSKWNDKEGFSRYEKYLQRQLDIVEEGGREEYAMEKMRGHINATLGGALGRMKELGLIYPVRSGRRKNFRVTELSHTMLS